MCIRDSFGDVFSEGFAFDSINGKMTVKDGLMRTDRLQIDGPGARVLMRGEADLKNETQRLNVNAVSYTHLVTCRRRSIAMPAIGFATP